MTRRLFLGVFIITLIIAGLFSVCYAVGDADTYKMTIQSIQLKNTSGDWKTIASPNREIDIASVSAGAVASTLIGEAPIEIGKYVNFKIVFSETLKFSGSDGANLTRSGGNITITGSDVAARSTATWAAFPPNATLTENTETHTLVAGQKGEITALLDLDAGDADDYIEVYGKTDLSIANAVDINKNSKVSMSFNFDTKNTVIYNAGNTEMFFTPPQTGTSFGITVDGTSLTITAASMRMDF